MSIFKRLENHYKSKSYLTYHAANEHEQLLLFYPNYKSTSSLNRKKPLQLGRGWGGRDNKRNRRLLKRNVVKLWL